MDRLIVVRDGVVIIVLVEVSEATVVEGERNVRIVSDRLIVVRDGMVIFTLLEVSEAAVKFRPTDKLLAFLEAL